MSDDAPSPESPDMPDAARQDRAHSVATTPAKRRAAAVAAFRDARTADKPVNMPPPAQVAADAAKHPEDEPLPEWLDLDRARARRRFGSERKEERAPAEIDAPYERPAESLRNYLETTRGEKFADDREFREAVHDHVTRVSSSVLGVALPSHVHARLDVAAARAGLAAQRRSAAQREAAERERAEREATDAGWSKVASAIDAKLAAGSDDAKRWPHLAADDEPGQLVLDVIRAAGERGERLSFGQAAQLADGHLRREHERRTSRMPAPAAPAVIPAEPSIKAQPVKARTLASRIVDEAPRTKASRLVNATNSRVTASDELPSRSTYAREHHRKATLARVREMLKGEGS